MDSVHDDRVGVEPITGLCRFRDGFYSCLGARADAQFELTEALLCADGPVRSLVDLSLAPEHPAYDWRQFEQDLAIEREQGPEHER